MAEVGDARAAHDLIARRASSVATIFSRLGEGVPLPLVARELARLGVPVFPCAPGGKRPIPERGFHKASTDAGQVEAWWRQRPRANLAFPTGAASGVVVVDVDEHKVDGYAAFGGAARSGLLPVSAWFLFKVGARFLTVPPRNYCDCQHLKAWNRHTSVSRRQSMRSAFALCLRIVRQFRHDPRTIAMLVAAPLLALWLLSAILGTPEFHPRIAITADLPTSVVDALEDEEAQVFVSSAPGQAVRDGEADASLSHAGAVLTVEVEGADASAFSATVQTVQAAVRELASVERDQLMADLQESLSPQTAENLTGSLKVEDIEVTRIYGDDSWGTFDYYGPVLIGIFIFAFIFITSGMSLITERTGGTIERLLASPIRAYELVLGYVMGFGIVALIQSTLVYWGAVYLIGFPSVGPPLAVFAVTVTLAVVSLTLGLTVSGAASTPLQVIQLMLIVVVPQILLSGIFSLTHAPAWLRMLSSCLPLSHGAEAMRNVMLRGATLPEILPQLGILWISAVGFFGLATLAFARRRN